MSLVAASELFSYVIGYYTVYLRSQPCLTNIQIAKDILGSPCIYFRHTSYMYLPAHAISLQPALVQWSRESAWQICPRGSRANSLAFWLEVCDGNQSCPQEANEKDLEIKKQQSQGMAAKKCPHGTATESTAPLQSIPCTLYPTEETNRLQMHLILLQSRLCYRTDSATEPCYRAALIIQCTDCPSSPATEQTSHHVYRFWIALLQSRLRRTCSIHISHESAVKGLQKKCCDERNVFICDWLFHCGSILSAMPCKH